MVKLWCSRWKHFYSEIKWGIYTVINTERSNACSCLFIHMEVWRNLRNKITEWSLRSLKWEIMWSLTSVHIELHIRKNHTHGMPSPNVTAWIVLSTLNRKICQDNISILNKYAPNRKTQACVKETFLKFKLHFYPHTRSRRNQHPTFSSTLVY